MRRYIYQNAGIIFFLFAITIAGCNKDDEILEPLIVDPIDVDIETDRLRGFNLQGKYNAENTNRGFLESDFQMIQELGFNFARLPIDYRTYTLGGDWYNYSETALKQIDEAIEWGSKYQVHCNLNLHRAPGYCINPTDALPPSQDLDLWTDPVAQQAFLDHWEMFAKRYKEVPPSVLSFNLVNEPNNVSSSVYAALCKKVIDVIHKHNPNRLIHVDGVGGAHDPVSELLGEKNVVHAVHNYSPIGITHYQANWVTGSNSWPVPTWPVYDISNGLYGSWKESDGISGPFTIEGSFSENTIVTIQIRQVSIQAEFRITLDDTEIFSKDFVPGPGDGDWSQVVETQWGYQNFYHKDYSVTLPVDGSSLDFFVDQGDWLTFNHIHIINGTDTVKVIPGNTSWGVKPGAIKITANGEITASDGSSAIMESPLLDDWHEFSLNNNVPIMVGECGVYSKTPHDVTLAYMEDMLKIMKDHNMNYALWNFRGTFGILDSRRADVDYENYNGYDLDRKYLDLLQKY